MNKAIITIFAFIFCTLIQSCLPTNQFAKRYYLQNNQWTYADAKSFTIQISDTSARYNLSLLMQHTELYSNSNIWMKLATTYPNGKIDTQKIEVPLAMPDGKWLGRKANGMIEHTMAITPNAGTISFSEKGQYTFTLMQDMRVSPLPNIVYIGIQLDKMKQP
jgi:gliding motility-associated lipoprotein GldH